MKLFTVAAAGAAKAEKPPPLPTNLTPPCNSFHGTWRQKGRSTASLENYSGVLVLLQVF